MSNSYAQFIHAHYQLTRHPHNKVFCPIDKSLCKGQVFCVKFIYLGLFLKVTCRYNPYNSFLWYNQLNNNKKHN